MKRINLETLAIGIAALLVFGLLYGIFVYNHTQNVNRDKFLIQHCQKINTQEKNIYTHSQTFECKP